MGNNLVWNLLNDLSKKSGITEISINGPKNIFVERGSHFIQLNANIPIEEIEQFIQDVAVLNGKKCDNDNPILDGNLPDGSRINVIRAPFTMGSPAISIRKYLKFKASFEENPEIFGADKNLIDFLRAAIFAKSNLIVSGGTGVGKTTFLNLLINEIPKTERLVTIEDTFELQINQPNLVRLESGAKGGSSKALLSTRDLVRNTLRMRPDRIIIGEVRGGELFDLLQAMNTGHEGSMASIHANSAGECLSRIETLFLLSGIELPLIAVRKQMAMAVDFIIQLDRNSDGKRMVSEVMELCGMEQGVVLSQKIFERDDEGHLKFTGFAPKSFEKLHKYGGLPLNFFE